MSDAIHTLRDFVGEHAKGVLTRTGIPRVDILKVTEPTELFPEIYQPLVSLILQGEKRLLVGNQVLKYTAGQTFIGSVELPVVGEIVDASARGPYLAVSLTFDRSLVADLLRDDRNPTKLADTRSFSVNRASDRLIDAWLRMLRLMEQPDEIAVMGPLLEREILFRLLRGPQGAVLRQVAGIDDRFAQIRNALIRLRKEYATAFQVEDLASAANMSPSAFQRRFKTSTGLSPIQYQKQIRLYEARGLLFAKPGNVSAVALAVGYESLSQFTREYARMFGSPPARDIRNLRANSPAAPPSY
ncbi:AraC family transcriptional regulator [Agrobacterium vitis]|uniref:Helix-turn-helix domain-containing protein n=1 Tax=Agrobacterium vitis TaxID=373 RepID=A0AAE5AVD7_AGRVI|nr:AraC family transcriptional regulator [Agrobacterium vitis]MCF1501737.1 AraC family transcriptional regulator [Allorhizobium sp. Av2]MCM2438756.1 AraC family transcriptional regulator [Agrobacterium vitis]MUZ56965.1 helix-turn-helix domain-containing protein [Agrobacterium vitis]MVA69143.1 helix-turn-helix domain-containing protein [Agrobacterium vitis]MVA85899.1 helix-turn-helix domain-containing protein [Agrobacterium vitis]